GTMTWQDKAIEALARNPKLGGRVMNTLDRLIDRILPPDENEQARKADEDETTEPEESEDQEMVYMTPQDYFMELCAAGTPLSLDDEVIKQFRDTAPDKFKEVLANLCNFDVDTIITYIVAQKASYKAIMKANPKQTRTWFTQAKT